MSHRYRMLIVALGCLTVEAALSQEPIPPEPETQVEAPSDNQDGAAAGDDASSQEQERAPDLLPAVNGIETAIRDLIAEQRDQAGQDPSSHEVRDLGAQEKMAKWAFWMFVASAATVVLTFAALLAILRTLHHTKRAADAAADMVSEAKATTAAAEKTIGVTREIGEAQVRAYLSVKELAVGVSSEGNFRIGIIAVNSGLSPARHCHAVCEVRWSDPNGAFNPQITHPIDLGDVPPGKESTMRHLYTDHTIAVPHTEPPRILLLKIGLFAADVFNKEIYCIEHTAEVARLMVNAEFTPDWTRTPPIIGSDDRGIKSRAWTGYDYVTCRPERSG